MERYIKISARYPLAIVLIIAIITAAAVIRLPELEFDISPEGMMVLDDPDRILYQRTLDTFGSDNTTVVFLSDDDLFNPKKLHAIRSVISEIEALPFVAYTQSLFSARHLKNVDGYITAEPYLDQIPASADEAAHIRAAALGNKLISGALISARGTAMAIHVYLDMKPSDRRSDRYVIERIDQVIAALSDQLKMAFQIGSPYIRNQIKERIYQDQRVILPLSLLVLLATLGLSLRRINAVLIPLLTAGLSVIWTLALMALLQIPINVMTSIVPALLIIIGSTEDIHLLAEYRTGTMKGMQSLDAIDYMAGKMGTAVFLTFVTTYVGFLSISLNNVEVLRQFGILASTGLLLNFLITVSLVPAWLRLFGGRNTTEGSRQGESIFHRFTQGLFQFVQKNKGDTIGLLILLVITFGYGAISLRVNNIPLDYFAADSPVIQRVTTMQEQLAGTETFSIVLSSGIEGTFLKVRYLEELKSLQTFLDNSGLIDKSFSFADYLELVNGVMEGDPSGNIYLPESDDIVQEYMLFIKRDHIREYVSTDYGEARIIVRHHIGSSNELSGVVQAIQAFVDEQIDPGLEVHIVGESILTAKAADYMASAQATSLVLMIIVIFVVISLLFVNIKAGLIAVVPNLIPIIMLFGVMGYTGIALNTGTAMIAAITLGICVDHTMHFMVRYHRITRFQPDEKKALRETVREEAIPIVAASLALAMGFGTLAASSFPPVGHFGVLSAMVILLALFATFIITPILLSSARLITIWDLLSMRLKAGVIEHCKLFRGMRPWQIKKIILVSDIREFKPGELMVRQGDQAKELFVLLEGSAEVWEFREKGSRIKVREMAAGEIFGEIALISSVTRTASVVALEKSQVLSFQWNSIRRIAKLFPLISAQLFHNLAAIISDRLITKVAEQDFVKDGVTGAYSRSVFEVLLGLEFERVTRYQEPLSLIILDLTDTQNRPLADSTLIQLTQLIKRQTRSIDILARWSQQRFLILLPRTNQDQANRIAEKLKESVRSLVTKKAMPIELTAVTVQLRDQKDLDALKKQAENDSFDKEDLYVNDQKII